jgi:2-polyprenyl-3-methyl-5-hydroxy-6-metoxy-1,4-benzoquinol methylase
MKIEKSMDETSQYSAYGTETLEIISEANQFNKWMYRTIRPHCCGNMLEAGSGIGNISRFFVDDGSAITLSDYDSGYFQLLKQKFGGYTNLQDIIRMDLSDEYLEEHHPALLGKYDTVFALNVVEHIANQEQALLNAYKLLRKGGRFVILVPAFQRLYNGFDEQLSHHRRYSTNSLTSIMRTAGFDVVFSRYFNFAAILGWFFFGNLLRNRVIPGSQLKLYDALVPVWKVIDVFLNRIAGLSIIQVGERR